MKPNTFNKPKPIQDIKPLKRNRHLRLKLGVSTVMLGFICLFFGLFLMLAKEYKDTHSFKFRSPIIVQKPLIIKREMTIISPLSTQSGSMNIAYAAELPQIDPDEVNALDKSEVKAYVKQETAKRFGIEQWPSMYELVFNESGFNVIAQNPTSTAFGMFQFLDTTWAGYNCEKTIDLEKQVKCGLDYVEKRYGSPDEAMVFWNENNWY